jgi:hypothetical protein
MRQATRTIAALAALLAMSATGQAQDGKIKKGAPSSNGEASSPAGDALLSDDFSSQTWGVGDDTDKLIEYVDNSLHFVVRTKNYFTWSTPSDIDYSDVHMEGTFTDNGSDPTTAFGFLCQQQAATSSFYYFAITLAGEYAIARAEEGKNDVFLTNNDKWATSPLITKNAKSYRVGADCGPGKLVLYVDGQKIDTAFDSTYTSGNVGAIVWSGEKAAKTDMSFDDFELTQLP